MATAAEMAAELQAQRQRLALSEAHATRLAEGLEQFKAEMHDNLTAARAQIATLEARPAGGGRDQTNLLDIKSMDPGTFAGTAAESWRTWAKKVKAYCNGRQLGFRAALGWCENEVSPIDSASLV